MLTPQANTIARLCGLKEDHIGSEGTTGLRGCCGDRCGGRCKPSNRFSVLSESDDDPPTLTDSEDENPKPGDEQESDTDSGDEVMNDDLSALLKSARKLAMRESLIEDKLDWSVYANRKSKRQQRTIKKRQPSASSFR